MQSTNSNREGADERPTQRVFHGTASLIKGPLTGPIFVTPDREKALLYDQGAGNGEFRVYEFNVQIENPFRIENEWDVILLTVILKNVGLSPVITPSMQSRGWDFDLPEAADHSPAGTTGLSDVAYIPAARGELRRCGYDAICFDDVCENQSVLTYALFDPQRALRVEPPAKTGSDESDFLDLPRKRSVVFWETRRLEFTVMADTVEEAIEEAETIYHGSSEYDMDCMENVCIDNHEIKSRLVDGETV